MIISTIVDRHILIINVNEFRGKKHQFLRKSQLPPPFRNNLIKNNYGVYGHFIDRLFLVDKISTF